MKQINEILDIRYPILQGGMAWVSDADLAAAVSNAGGLGVIAAGNAPGDWLEQQIKKVKKLTDKPFGVNVMLLSPYVEEAIDIVTKHKVPVIITGAGNPGPYIQGFKSAGSKVIPVIASLALAKRLQRQDIDALIAEGSEAGGHIGELSTMVLVPEIVEEVDLPVIAAGGICDAKTACAAFCLGASGIQVGTRFILAKECNTHQEYKDRLKKAKDVDSKVTGRITGHPVRLLRSPFSRELLKMEYVEGGADKIEEAGAGSLMKAVLHGDKKEGSFMAGQCACRLDDEFTAKEIIEDIFNVEKTAMCLDTLKKGY